MRVVVRGWKVLVRDIILRHICERDEFGISLRDSVPLIICHSRKLLSRKRPIKWRVVEGGLALTFKRIAMHPGDVGTFYTFGEPTRQ